MKKNILHLETTTEKAADNEEEEDMAAKNLEQAVREGQIAFRPTTEGVPTKQVTVPKRYSLIGMGGSGSFDEDSNDALSPKQESTPTPSPCQVRICDPIDKRGTA